MTGLLAASLFADLGLALGVSASVCFSLRVRAEMRKSAHEAAGKQDLLEATSALSDRVCALEERLANLEASKADQLNWVAGTESLNLNKRGQVLRLHRRGDSVPDIASALRVGLGEVKLMIKVQEIFRELPAQSGSPEQVQ